MKYFNYLSILTIFMLSCQNSGNESTYLIASFGDQPSIIKNTSGEIMVVFGAEESIYYSVSKNQGDSFSTPSLVAKLEGLVVGYASGPGIATTPTNVVVTAPDKDGNLYAWSRPVASDDWSGPFRINDVERSVGESLSDITSTPDGHLFCVWIDTRFHEEDNRAEHTVSNHESHVVESIPEVEEDLDEITPIGITKRALYKRIGNVPENAHLAFHDDNEGKLYWVFLDTDKNVLKAESLEEYTRFRERNNDRVKTQGKIYLASSQDGGKTWAKSKMIFKSPDGSVCECCKPSIISDHEGNLIIMFRNNVDGSRDLYFTKSTDGGNTFSNPEKLGTGTWKINGCPMDGGNLMVNKDGEMNTIWRRKGDIFMANSSSSEEKIGSGKSPTFTSNDQQTYIAFSQGEDIMTITSNNQSASKIGTGSSPKVIALDNGAIYFWVNKEGVHYKKIL